MMLPSFPALRERNLRTLYGNDYKEYIVNGSNGGRSKRGATANTTTFIDKSPKGSVDVRIQPLVNLINCHPDYVTLSSCSGRVALFDPGGYDNIAAGGDDGDVDVTTVVADNDDDHYDNTRGDDISKNNNNKSSDEDDGEAKLINNRDNNIRKSTKKSGKGQGKWIFVTHDILPNLGECIIASLQHTGQERAVALMQQRRQRRRQSGVQHQHKLQLPITFKHEPPLLHIAASNLQSAKHLLQLCKMNCALRESGLVVTESRITVEIRTTSTMLVIPLFIDILVHEEAVGDEGVGGVLSLSSHQLCNTKTTSKCDDNDHNDDNYNAEQSSSSLLLSNNSYIEQQNNDNNNNNNVGYTITLLPSEKYLLMVAELANERMVHNGILIDKLFDIIQSELFISTSIMDNSISSERIESSGMKNVHSNNTHKNKDNNDDDYELDKYKVSIRQTLPPINLWKTAAVALRRCGRRNCHNHHHHQQQQLSSSVDDHNTIDSTNNIINNSKNDCNNDLDVLVFGGQGIGPQFSSCTTNINNNDVVDEDEYRVNSSNSTTYGQSSSSSSSSCCHRWDDVFQLKRRSGVWSEKWATISRITMTMLMPLCDGLLLNGDDYESVISMTTTTVGNLRIRVSDVGMGKREGHTAVVIPPHQQNKHQKRRSSSRSNNMNDKSTEHDPCLSMTVDNAVIIFGGRTTIKSINSDDGGIQRLLLPSNDLFLFVLVPSSSSSSSSSLSMPLHTNSMNDNCKENMNVQQSLFVEKEEEEDNMMGLFGKPLDVRGSPPEARYGHTMTILPNTKQCHGSPFAVVAGGTGLNNCCLASMYTLSCIIPTINNTNINAEDADHTFFQYSHFVWDRIADMPSPRTYHTNFILDENSEQSMKMFVFGGYSVADDPFTSSWVNTPPFGISIADSTQVVDDATPHDNLTITVDKKVQFHMNCIGSAVIALPNLPNVVLVVGGVKAFYDNDDDNDDDNNVVYDNGNVQPLMLLSVQQKQHGPLKLSPKLDVIISSDINNELDFGACVHHCLVSLPSQQDDGDHCNYTDCSDNSEQLIIVGGGVPSLSFGQSYAQSYVIDVTRSILEEDEFNLTHAHRHYNSNINHSTLPTKAVESASNYLPSKNKTIKHSKPLALTTIQTDVVYVSTSNAKEVKNALESLGYYDKRYKLVKVYLDNSPVVAIPVTQQCMHQFSADSSENLLLHDIRNTLIIRIGSEAVPLSSSLIGKMKQRR